MTKTTTKVAKTAEAVKGTKDLNIYQKLLEVKRQVPYLKKDSKGYNYDYASPEEVLGAFNPILNEIGLFLKTEIVSQETERINTGKKEENLFRLSLIFTWVNVDNPEETVVTPWQSAGVNSDDKGLGSALTYAERYFLLKTFNVPTGKDDPDARQEPPQKAQKRATTNAKPKVDPILVKKNKITLQLKELGLEVTKDNAKEVVKEKTALELEEKNFDEIISRLSALIDEKNDSN